MDALAARALEWHFIGPIQSNKTRSIAARFDWVHTLDREKVVRRLGEERPEGLAPLNCLVEINVSCEPRKAGIPLEALADFLALVADCPRLRLRGIMALPALNADPGAQRAVYRRLVAAIKIPALAAFGLDTLSLGTSDDWEAAVAEGSTLIRIGTALFGARERGPASPDSGALDPPDPA